MLSVNIRRSLFGLFRHKATYPLLLFLAVGLSACNPSKPVSFRDLCILGREQFGIMNFEQALPWIENRYLVQPEMIQRMEDNELITTYNWVNGPVIRLMKFRSDRLVLFSQGEMLSGPKFSQVVAGLGPPESVYSAGRIFETIEYAILLEYPSQGISVGRAGLGNQGGEFRNDKQLEARLSPDFQVTHIDCYQPVSSLDELLRVVYRDRPDMIEQHKRQRIAWPGFGAWVPLN